MVDPVNTTAKANEQGWSEAAAAVQRWENEGGALLSLAACDAKRDPAPGVVTKPATPVSKPTLTHAHPRPRPRPG